MRIFLKWVLGLIPGLVCAISPSCPFIQGIDSPINVLHVHVQTLYHQLSCSSITDTFELIHYSSKNVSSVMNHKLIFVHQNSFKKIDNFIGISIVQKDDVLLGQNILYSVAKYIESDNVSEVKTILAVNDDQIVTYQCENLKEKFGSFLHTKGILLHNEGCRNNTVAISDSTGDSLLNFKEDAKVYDPYHFNSTIKNIINKTDINIYSKVSNKTNEAHVVPRSNTGSQTSDFYSAKAEKTLQKLATSSDYKNKSTINHYNGFLSINNSDHTKSGQNSYSAKKNDLYNTTTDLRFNYNYDNSEYDWDGKKENINYSSNSSLNSEINEKTSHQRVSLNSISKKLEDHPANFVDIDELENNQLSEIDDLLDRLNNTNQESIDQNKLLNLSLLSNYPVYSSLPTTTSSIIQPIIPNNITSDINNASDRSIDSAVQHVNSNDFTNRIKMIIEKNNEEIKQPNSKTFNEQTEKELIKKLYLIMSYKKRQEESERFLSANIRPTEFLVSNLYENINKISSGQTPNVPINNKENASLENEELRPYLNFNSSQIFQLIKYKENLLAVQINSQPNYALQFTSPSQDQPRFVYNNQPVYKYDKLTVVSNAGNQNSQRQAENIASSAHYRW
jgi:hypothetical protein